MFKSISQPVEDVLKISFEDLMRIAQLPKQRTMIAAVDIHSASLCVENHKIRKHCAGESAPSGQCRNVHRECVPNCFAGITKILVIESISKIPSRAILLPVTYRTSVILKMQTILHCRISQPDNPAIE